MAELLPELKSFIIDFCKKYKIRNVDYSSLDTETNIEVDLDIFDLDADMLLSEFVERFNVDYTEFSWNNYGYPTGTTIISILKVVFGSKSIWIQNLSQKFKHTEFKLKNLQEAIKSGKLV
jgi:hypothetical protein